MTNESKMYGAIVRGDATAVRDLLANDPTILKVYKINKSWLHWAAQFGQIEIMDVLLSAGMHVDEMEKNGNRTPLKSAAGQGKYDACNWLLNHHADVNHGFGTFATPIFGAVFGKSIELVKLFIEYGARLDATFGTPEIDLITYAQKYGSREIIEFLMIEMDANH